MEELKKIYEENFIPAWKETHAEGEPPCFEEWKDNDFWEWLEDYVDNQSYEWQARLINSYAENCSCGFGPCHDMDTLNDYDFTDIYDNIDHENFNVRHDVYWSANGYEYGFIRSGDFCDYVNEYWDDNKEDIFNYVINHFDTFVQSGDIDPSDYEYE